MGVKNMRDLKALGFKKCKKIGSLDCKGLCEIPDKRGVYAVLRQAKGRPGFLKKNPAGHFKGDPTVTKDVLREKWVDASQIIYIGQAGGRCRGVKSNATLRERITTFIKFGRGKRVAHWGGRLVWQIKDSDSLVICWKVETRRDPRKVEKEMLENFKKNFGQLPFANWRT